MSITYASKGKVHLTVCPAKTAPAVCVSVGIDFKASESVLCSIQHGTPLEKTELLHESSLFMAVAKHICFKLAGKPLDVIKYKYIRLRYSAGKSTCTISVVCTPSKSAARRIAKTIVACWNPAKVYQLYSTFIKSVGEPANREYFNHAANSMIKALRTKITILISGKIAVDQTFANDIADKASTAMDKITDISGSMASPKVHKAEATSPEKVESFQVDEGVGAYLNASYLHELTQHKVWVANGYLYSSATKSKVDKASDKERIARFVTSIMKLVDKASGILIYLAASSKEPNASALESECKKQYTTENLSALMKKTFK